MTVVDSSAVIDYLAGDASSVETRGLLERPELPVSSPDLLVFEVLAAVRRNLLRGEVEARRAEGAIRDLGDLAIELFPTMPLRFRAWQLRENMTMADGLFVALAELLDEPLATKDRRLARAARDLTGVETIEIG